MKTNRREFLRASAGAGLLAVIESNRSSAAQFEMDEFDIAAARPVLDLKGLNDPVIIESIELLRKDVEYFLRVRSKDGVEGISLDNGRADVLHPILTRLVAPYFIGKDARDLEELLFGVYRERDNYKFQGLALWCPVAMVEFAILDLLGRVTGRSIGQLLGGVVRKSMPFYIASGRRDTTPQQEVDYLKQLIEETGASSVKYRVGGRMSRNEDASPGRTEQLIPLSRKALGDDIAIHADSNSSYDAAHAIPVGRMLEDIDAVYFEEPCPFDDFDDTKKVTDALKIPIALGEQEFSHARFKSMIRHGVADIVQPDLFYYGGLIRSIRVSRMADLRNLPTTVHLSGGFGFVYSLHFAAAVENIGPWQEYKQGVETYGQWFDPPLRIVDGAISIPEGPGVGIADAKEVLKGAVLVKN
ncbi:MAG TPA: mandelate racemase/muconate lactonizing enzyme family protein [Lacipirellulaceae bacterium]|nr:mandelate racemase/muconate lactonizing enzyme family protein [Lacipirellulaceae bacterium]